jgi:hypothetical protein
MPRHAFAFVFLAASMLVAANVSAAGPAPADRKRAAEHYDAGVAAFKKKKFEDAAAHFEEANATLPSAAALRQAIRARSEAGHGARAATLAAQALDKYPNDGPLFKVAHDALEKYEVLVEKLKVKCASPCTVTVGDYVVPGEARQTWVVYVDPGSVTLKATYANGSADVSKEVDAKAGEQADVSLEPKKQAPPPPVEVPAEPVKVDPPPEREDKKEDDKDDGQPRKGISPVFFGVGAAAFVGLGIATIWSGIDTEKNPGAAAVRMDCQGKGTSCPQYQLGLAHQTRTNALVGATVGVGAVTTVLGIFTNWRGNKKPPPAEPTAIVVDRGGVLGARGAF